MKQKAIKEYLIPYVGLQNKLYEFSYSINETFFTYFDDNDIKKCLVDVKLEFEKRESFFLLNFYIDGFVEVPCDRCLDPYKQEIFGDYEVLVKFDTEQQEDNEDEDIIYISKSDDFIDVSKLIYDFILLSIPLRCVHPNDENGNSLCNQQIIKKLENKTEEESTDPRWAALEKLKNKKQ